MRGRKKNVSREDAKTQSAAWRQETFAPPHLCVKPWVIGSEFKTVVQKDRTGEAPAFGLRRLDGPEGDFAVANRAYAEGDFAAALRACERTLAGELHANALYNLGNTCF